MTFSFDETIKLPFGTLSKQEAGILLAVQDEAIKCLAAAQEAYNRIAAALVFKYSQQARTERLAIGKEAGVVQFEDNGVQVTVDQPMRIEWDQEMLAGIVARMRSQDVDPTDFIDIHYSVPDTKYQAWSPALQESFTRARKVVYSQALFHLSLLSEPLAVTP